VAARILVFDDRGEIAKGTFSVLTDSTGRFSTDVPPGLLTVIARTNTDATQEATEILMKEGSNERVKLRIDAAGTLLLRSAEARGPGDTLRILDRAGRNHAGMSGERDPLSHHSRPPGTYRFGPLPPGEYRVIFNGTEQEIQIRAGDETEVSLDG
jgi:hypothetical protein